jgi:hypothetical protein
MAKRAMSDPFSDSDLAAFIDEALPVELMTRIEDSLRGDETLLARLVSIHQRRDAGVHALGEIWRRGRLSCPTREELGSFLLGALPHDAVDYVRFHLETIGCRSCQANLADLETQRSGPSDQAETRRRKYFQSSVGKLKR